MGSESTEPTLHYTRQAPPLCTDELVMRSKRGGVSLKDKMPSLTPQEKDLYRSSTQRHIRGTGDAPRPSSFNLASWVSCLYASPASSVKAREALTLAAARLTLIAHLVALPEACCGRGGRKRCTVRSASGCLCPDACVDLSRTLSAPTATRQARLKSTGF